MGDWLDSYTTIVVNLFVRLNSLPRSGTLLFYQTQSKFNIKRIYTHIYKNKMMLLILWRRILFFPTEILLDLHSLGLALNHNI